MCGLKANASTQSYCTEPQIGRKGDFAFEGECFASFGLLNQTCSEGTLLLCVCPGGGSKVKGGYIYTNSKCDQ